MAWIHFLTTLQLMTVQYVQKETRQRMERLNTKLRQLFSTMAGSQLCI